MELIRSFCGFSLAACAAQLLLPEGSLRKTAALSIGLMTSLLWLDGLLPVEMPDLATQTAGSALTGSGVMISQDDVCGELLSKAASAAAGCEVQVLWDGDGITDILVYSGNPESSEKAADALNVDSGRVNLCGAR